MNKQDLISAVLTNKKSGLHSKAAASRAVNAVVSGMKTGIRKDGEVQHIGFGTFRVKKRPARKGRMPGTGEVIRIKASKTVAFRCGTELKSVAARCKAIK